MAWVSGAIWFHHPSLAFCSCLSWASHCTSRIFCVSTWDLGPRLRRQQPFALARQNASSREMTIPGNPKGSGFDHGDMRSFCPVDSPPADTRRREYQSGKGKQSHGFPPHASSAGPRQNCLFNQAHGRIGLSPCFLTNLSCPPHTLRKPTMMVSERKTERRKVYKSTAESASPPCISARASKTPSGANNTLAVLQRNHARKTCQATRVATLDDVCLKRKIARSERQRPSRGEPKCRRPHLC